MILYVEHEEFAAAAKRECGHDRVYVAATNKHAILTAAHPESDCIVAANYPHSVKKAIEDLKKQGCDVFEGSWIPLQVEQDSEAKNYYVAAVAYLGGEEMPGLWVDSYETEPTEVQAVKAMYDEFCKTGELSDVTFEDFMKMAKPNVVVVTPVDLQSFINEKNNTNGGC